MKNLEKRIDELYQYVEEMDLRCKADNLKRYELQERIDKAIEYIEKDLQISILPNNQIINGTEVVKRINKIEDILKGDSDEK